MANNNERLDSIRVKALRAKDHLRCLEAETHAYLASNPYVIGTKRDPHTRRLVYFISSVQPTPATLSTVLGDAIHNLRSALDHLAYQLVSIGTGTTPSSHVYFPIADDAAKYNKNRTKQLCGARPEAILAIDALTPYRVGNDVLWKLHKLDVIDKHRALITAGSAFRSIDLGSHLFRKFQGQEPRLAAIDTGQHSAFFRVADRMFPLQTGDELFIDGPDALVDDELQFQFDVAMGEPGVVAGESVLETIGPMMNLVDKIISSFEPMLC